jgi:hypothetical protein
VVEHGSSFEKNLSEAIKFALVIKDLPLEKVNEKELTD